MRTIHHPEPASWETIPEARVSADDMGSSIVIAHPDEVIRTGLEAIVAKMPQVRQSRSCPDWSTAVTLLPNVMRGSIWVVSHSLFHQDAARMSMLQSSGQKVMLLLRGVDSREVADAAELGPDGFLIEGGVSTTVLLETISTLRQGRIPMPPELTRGLLTEIRRPVKSGVVDVNLLTPREMEILKFLTDGCSNKEIAKNLGISINGVKRHVGNVLAKLNCPNRTMAAVEAVRLKII